MKSNSDLLFDQLRQQPNDLTLLSAYMDSLLEEGDPLAELVRELLLLTEEYAMVPVDLGRAFDLIEQVHVARKRLGLL